MAQLRLGIVMHGVTGRMGLHQHLRRSIVAMRDAGGVRLRNGDTVVPDPLLLGRRATALRQVAAETGCSDFTTDYDAALRSPRHALFFDAGTTQMRPHLLARALEAGKHVYCEKPVADSRAAAVGLRDLAARRGLKAGVVMDKLFLPGLIKLKQLRDRGLFGRILAVRIEFGYWVFTGEQTAANRPSWNYRLDDGGGIIFDMMAHWRYVLDEIVAPVRAILCHGANHIHTRWDERGAPYRADADDAAYAILELEDGIVAQINSSWCTRVHRDDLVTFQIDGTDGSACAGLTDCRFQTLAQTPRPVWNPDEPQAMRFREQWTPHEPEATFPNGFRAQWERFIRYLYDEAAWPHTLGEGVKGVELAEAALQSWRERRWIALPRA